MNASNTNPPEPFFGRNLTLRQFVTLRRFLALSGAAVLLGALTLVARSDSPAAQSVAARPAPHGLDDSEPLIVQVEPALSVDSFSVGRTYTGLVAAARISRLGFERSARVIELRVDEGDSVAKGDVLAILDARQLETERQRLEAQRDQAKALLAELKSGPRMETIAAAKAEVVDLAAQLELQRRNLERTTELVRQNAVSRERHDEVELGVQSARAKLDVAQRRLDELEAGTRREQIDAQQAVVDQLTAALADLAIEIKDSELLAPFHGTISARHVDEGTVVSSAETVFEIVESGGLEAHVGLPPQVFRSLATGQRVDVEIGNRVCPASLSRSPPWSTCEPVHVPPSLRSIQLHRKWWCQGKWQGSLLKRRRREQDSGFLLGP